jgi:hypothetical protein
VDALQNQLADLTAILQPGAKGSVRGSRGSSGKDSD